MWDKYLVTIQDSVEATNVSCNNQSNVGVDVHTVGIALNYLYYYV